MEQSFLDLILFEEMIRIHVELSQSITHALPNKLCEAIIRKAEPVHLTDADNLRSICLLTHFKSNK
jgi:hypothetical protein